jgi:hypothetical protein
LIDAGIRRHKKKGYHQAEAFLIMLPTATASSATEEAASIEMQPEPIHDISNKSDEVATDKDEEITSQSSSEPKEAPVPSDKVRLNLLLVSGRKLIIDTDKDDTITQVKTLVLKQWPTGITNCQLLYKQLLLTD